MIAVCVIQKRRAHALLFFCRKYHSLLSNPGYAQKLWYLEIHETVAKQQLKC
jgi:hypothetical protein